MVSPRRYFVLDFEAGLLQYFVNEHSKHQKPRGALSLSGAIVSLSDEAPHMLVVYSANGEMYKLRGTLFYCSLFRQASWATVLVTMVMALLSSDLKKKINLSNLLCLMTLW